MKTKLAHEAVLSSRAMLRAALLAWSTVAAGAFPIITNVVETGGDNEATDTVTAKWTGVTFSNGVAAEFPTPYTVGLFREDAPAYVDRTHQWNGATAALPLPPYLVGGEYIMIGNDNRDNAALQLDISVSEAALVYLLIDNRLTDGSAADPPESGLPLDQWTGMAWVNTEGFAPVLNGLNRNLDPNIPDEVGVDESGDVDIDNYSSVYFKAVEAGTFSIYQPDNAGRNMYGVVVKALPGSASNPPEIVNLSPTNNTLFYNPASGIIFSATTFAPNRINATNIILWLDGADVSASLVLGGNATNRTVSYNNLAPNTIYSARLAVSDQNGRAVTNDFRFDTFLITDSFNIEAEDYNYENGKVLDFGTPDGYANLVGTPEIDYHDNNATSLAAQYRLSDYVGLAISTDGRRPSPIGTTNYHVTQFVAGDWMNYTRPFPDATTCNVFLRVSGTTPQQVRLDKIRGDPTTENQVPFALGTFAVPNTVAAGGFTYVPLTDLAGNPVAISLSGLTTLRLTALYSPNPNLQLNFLLLVPTTTSAGAPRVTSASPSPNAIDVPLDGALNITIANGATQVASGSVALNFNGSDVTSSASVSTTADGVQVAFDPPGLIATNTVYPASLVFKDTAGVSFTNQWSFTTVPFKPIITSVVETDGDDSVNAPAQYTGQTINHPNLGAITLGTFREEAPAYRSRVHQWNGAGASLPLPSYLAGGEYIMILQENRDNSPYQLDVTVAEPAFVFVLVDNRLFDGSNANPPDFSAGNMSWLLDNGWVPFINGLNRGGTITVPDEVGMDEGADGVGPGAGLNQWSSVYARIVPAGTVSLYQPDNAGANMYGVVVRSVASHAFVPTVAITSPANETTYPAGPTHITITADASVTNSSIAKVELFSGTSIANATNKIGEATSAPYSIIWSNANVGRYMVSAKATAANGQSKVSAPVSVIVGKVTSVNFQAATAEVPTGYLPDYGDVFGDHGNGYNYGWDDDNTQHARDRNDARSPDERYDTFTHMQKTSPLPAGRFWEIELPTGRYSVHAVVGEASNQDSVYDLQVEGVTIVTGTPDAVVRWFENTAAVTVSDGRLTLSNGPAATNNKVAFVDIAELPAEVPRPVFAAPSLSGNTLTLTWTGGGKLQQAPEVTGQWTDVPGNPNGSFTVQTTEPRKFYRVVVP